MSSKENLEETGKTISHGFSGLIQKVKPIYVLCAVLPLIFIYPKPLMLILKPIIRNWSFHYRKINSISNKPSQIILTSNSNINFSKQYLKSFKVLKGTLPDAFKQIQESIRSQEQLKIDEDESMKNVLVKKKHQFKKQRIFRSCFVIDMQDAIPQKGQKNRFQSSLVLHQRKNSHSQKIKEDEKDNEQSIYSQNDYIWVEMIMMKLKILQLENNSQVIQHVIIKANQKVLQLLQSKILGIKQSEAFKLGTICHNKIHLLKFNKNLDTYEHCSTTFKIQQAQQLNVK